MSSKSQSEYSDKSRSQPVDPLNDISA